MDYSKLSDDEINNMVGHLVSQRFRTDYCNDPGAAWPIISKHRISIEFDGDNSTEPQTTWCHTTNLGRTIGTQYQKNPLRAAMITFLMMQGSQDA
ncbi:phage protein NinX family protein [Cronobacter sakazakii]|uniref:phage protein NinX family protein n=1 Tax=Cronobacter sakazakii TaxID=28141 RepID=UPI0004981A80|nr:phage protein NinX family protein [Cronobacter sakazakii]EGT4409573.1 DUF2591 domain-containing protein [Cronobacter sakazakii]KAB1040120.1 DUF2591 domain-containing protein [Cronobacter sakazakii]KAB1056097.1 DUF2591 domain-containing protein [Cronobacter sakazakii]MDK1308297.1 DUF2591 family protein [Cronobacter sakazakii]HAU5504913.1 DUF2591 domain-containing protein [Cronobacter sakazakii]